MHRQLHKGGYGLERHLRSERRLAMAAPPSARGMSKDWDLQQHHTGGSSIERVETALEWLNMTPVKCDAS